MFSNVCMALCRFLLMDSHCWIVMGLWLEWWNLSRYSLYPLSWQPMRVRIILVCRLLKQPLIAIGHNTSFLQLLVCCMASFSWIENSNVHAFDSFYTVSIVSSTCTFQYISVPMHQVVWWKFYYLLMWFMGLFSWELLILVWWRNLYLVSRAAVEVMVAVITTTTTIIIRLCEEGHRGHQCWIYGGSKGFSVCDSGERIHRHGMASFGLSCCTFF